MFERSQYPERSFLDGGTRYNYNTSRWLPRSRFPAELDTMPEFQTFALMKSSIFSLTPIKQDNNSLTLASINLITQKPKIWTLDQKGLRPKLRSRCQMIEHAGCLYVFGGRLDNQYFSDFRMFNVYTQTWELLELGGRISPRIPQIFTSLNAETIFLFGGQSHDTILTDAYIIQNNSLTKVQCEDIEQLIYISKLKDVKFCTIQESIFLFGGFDGEKYLNQLYQITVNLKQNIMHIHKLNPYNQDVPMGRIRHSMTSINDKFIIVACGCQGEKVALQDINVYDIEQNKWFTVHPNNGPLQPLCDFQMFTHKNSVYFCGGINPKNTSVLNRSLIQLTFAEYQMIKSELCSQCSLRLENQEKEDYHAPKKPFVSNGFIYNMAIDIAFPFQGIGLITDIAKVLKATTLSIRTCQTSSLLSYIDIKFNGNALSREQFISIISHSYNSDPVVLEIIDRIKLGGQRLGKTLVFVTVEEDMRRVFLFSSDSLITSHYDQVYAYYAYEQRIADEWISTYEGIMHHKFIINTLKSYLKNPEANIFAVQQHGVFIFQCNVLMSADKIYYNELVGNNGDIIQSKNTKKVEFLSQVGFQLTSDPQISLSSYLHYLYLNNPFDQLLILDEVSNPHLSYPHQLQKLEQEGKLKRLEHNKIIQQDLQLNVQLYTLTNQKQYIPELKGIFIYNNGRLINRYGCQFGNLFWQKFYKTKYKHPFPVWSCVGVVDVVSGLEPKSTMHEFKNTGNYRMFVQILKGIIKPESYHRAKQFTLILDDGQLPMKKVKDM